MELTLRDEFRINIWWVDPVMLQKHQINFRRLAPTPLTTSSGSSALPKKHFQQSITTTYWESFSIFTLHSLRNVHQVIYCVVLYASNCNYEEEFSWNEGKHIYNITSREKKKHCGVIDIRTSMAHIPPNMMMMMMMIPT